jgi:hypothetical protein
MHQNWQRNQWNMRRHIWKCVYLSRETSASYADASIAFPNLGNVGIHLISMVYASELAKKSVKHEETYLKLPISVQEDLGTACWYFYRIQQPRKHRNGPKKYAVTLKNEREIEDILCIGIILGDVTRFVRLTALKSSRVTWHGSPIMCMSCEVCRSHIIYYSICSASVALYFLKLLIIFTGQCLCHLRGA